MSEKHVYKLQRPLNGQYSTDGGVEVLAYKEGHENTHTLELNTREILKLFRGNRKVFVRVAEDIDGFVDYEELMDIDSLEKLPDQGW